MTASFSVITPPCAPNYIYLPERPVWARCGEECKHRICRRHQHESTAAGSHISNLGARRRGATCRSCHAPPTLRVGPNTEAKKNRGVICGVIYTYLGSLSGEFIFGVYLGILSVSPLFESVLRGTIFALCRCCSRWRMLSVWLKARVKHRGKCAVW